MDSLIERIRRLAERLPGKRWLLATGVPLLALGLGWVSLRPDADAAGPRELASPEAFAPPASAGEDWFEAQAEAPAARAESSDYECLLAPADEVEIGSPVIGLIESIPVDRSDFVEAGQVIVQLESNVESAAVRVAAARSEMEGVVGSRTATFELERHRRERAAHLFEKNAVSLDVREEVETQAKVAELELLQAREEKRLSSLELNQAEAVLNRRSIRSPISGVVVDRMMSPGEVVDEEKILRIAQIDPLRVEAVLPAAMFGSVHVGSRAAVTPEQPGDALHVAEVVMVDRVIDPASGTFTVRMNLPNPDHAIPSGLHCELRFLEDEAEQVGAAAPTEAPPARAEAEPALRVSPPAAPAPESASSSAPLAVVPEAALALQTLTAPASPARPMPGKNSRGAAARAPEAQRSSIRTDADADAPGA